jgi:transcriptional regulator with XRE-family HTH domain
MVFSKKRVKQFDDYGKIRKARMSTKERMAQDTQIDQEVEALQSMREAVAGVLARYMEDEDIGINELTRRLQTSSRQTSRIMKGEANITLATLAEMAALIGVKPRIVFE